MTKYDPKVCFECVAGEVSGMIFNMLPRKSKMYLYGSLSLKPLSGISPVEVIYNEKDLLHLSLRPYLKLIKYRLPDLINETKKYYKDCFGSQLSKECNYEEIKEALNYYKENMSSGKVILKPKF